jgi:beta-lactamase regulating signal transducer with metallopeptidase domain
MIFSGAGPLALFLAKATFLLIAALLATFSLRRSTAGARHLVWLAALVGVLALPVLSRIPALQLPMLPSLFGSETVIAPRASAPARVMLEMPIAAAPAMPAVPAKPIAPPAPATEIVIAAGAPSPAPVAIVVPPVPEVPPVPGVVAFPVLGSAQPGWMYSALLTVAIIWGAVALALIGWLVAGALQVRRIVARGRELTSPDWTMPLCEVADRLDLETPPRLVMSDRIEMAFACRALNPTVVVPESAESWSDDRRRAVLFHELAHVKRHDLLGHTLGRIACALYWFHPLVWTAAKNLRAESERACDDLVLSCGARPSEYAQHLLDMVTSVRNHGAPVMALPMARKKEFEGRMLAILDPAIRRASPGKWQAASVIASLAALSLTVAAVSPVAAAPDGSSGSVAAVPAPPTVDIETPRTSQATPTPTPTPSPSGGVKIEVGAPTASGQSVTVSTGDFAPVMKFSEEIANAAARASVGAVAKVLNRVVGRLGQQPVRGDTAKVAILIRILETDSDAGVRRAAAWGLNESPGERVRAALINALRSDADASVREMAAWALSEHESDVTASALGDALEHDKSARVRETAAWALGQIDSHHETSALENALSDSSERVRESAIWALGQAGQRAAPRAVINALTDNSTQLRLVAAWALAEFEDKSAADALTKAFQAETNAEVRAAEMRALAAVGAISPEIVEVALKSSDPALRRRAVAMLAGDGSGVWVWPWPRPQPRQQP